MKKFFSNPWAIFVFVTPTLGLFSLMLFYPLLQVLIKSFYDWNGITEGFFIGADNYVRIFKDPLFYRSVKNGLIFAFILMIGQIPLATVLALGISGKKFRGHQFLRIAYFIPVVLSVTVVCQLWLSIYNPEFGLINRFLSLVGIEYQQDWLTGKGTAITSVALTNVWHYMGMHFALIFAGIKAIPKDYYESAMVDGATSRKAHWYITLPLLAETYKYCLVMAITGGLNAFTQMYIMTNGGPGTQTYTLTFMMYRSAFKINNFGYGCSVAVVLVVECLIATMIINKMVARERITY